MKRAVMSFGMDLSPAMLEEAKSKLGVKAELLLGSASEMRYQDNFFDLVIGSMTLHEMPRTVRFQVVNEMVRVLKQDGRILIIDFHPGSIRSFKGWLYKAVVYFFEVAAGREHFKNFREFRAINGIPGLV